MTEQQSSQMQRSNDPATQIAGQLKAMQKQLAASLPRHLTAERVSRVFLTTLRMSPALLRCSPQSLYGALFQASSLGLEIGTGLGHAYLVPYNKNATLIIGYRGLVELARRSGQISTVYAYEVRDGDVFDYELGVEPTVRHKPAAERNLRDSAITHFYAVARLKDGGVQFEVMSRAEVDAIRERSRAGRDGPWVTDYAMMGRKTVLRRLCKLLPSSIELQVAVTLDEHADANIGQVFDVDVPQIEEDVTPAEREPGEEV